MSKLEEQLEDVINSYIETQVKNSSSFYLACELHYFYKEKGFYPSEFVEDITKQISKIKSWPDAIIKVMEFIDEREKSNAIH